MIPRTYPSVLDTFSGKRQMVVYQLADVTGLQRWKDYIPVKASPAATIKENSYDNDGAILVKDIGSTYQKQAWIDYVPVFVDALADDAWQVSGEGFIPISPAPSLNLDFTSSSETLDPRITFSRTTNATRINSAGVLEYAPHNLVTFSEQFDNAVWTKTAVTVSTNVEVSPDNTSTADKLVEDTANASHQIGISGITAPTTVVSTFSFYAKAAGRTVIQVRYGVQSLANRGQGNIDLSNGTVAIVQNIGTATGTTITASPVGNGWYRVVISTNPNDAASTQMRAIIILGSVAVSSMTGAAYLGDGTSGVFLWGAQLNVGALQPYYPTTVKNLLGFSEAFENAAWTKSNSFIQTNLLLQSQAMDTAANWVNETVTIAANTGDTTAPDGTSTAEKFTDDATNTFHGIRQVNLSLTANTNYACSVFVKAGTHNFVQLLFRDATATGRYVTIVADLSTGTISENSVGASGTLVSSAITSVGNSWYRIQMVASLSAVGVVANNTFAVRFAPLSTGNTFTTFGSIEYAGTGTTFYAWGAQVVQGSTPGDYQQTFSAALPVMYKAPNGLMTADKFVGAAGTSIKRIRQNVTTTALGPWTYSIWLKADTAVSALVTLLDNSVGGVNNVRTTLTFSTGLVSTAVAAGTATQASASVTPFGNGWYRVSITGTFVTALTSVWAEVWLDGFTSTASETGFYIWGAQLSDSASLDTYVNNPGAAPTSTAYYGPRFDYDPVTRQPKGLLIEEQRTNSIRNNMMVGAVAGTPGTLPTNWANVAFAGLTLAVVGTGVQSGINYIDIKYSGTTTDANNVAISFDGATSIAASNGQVWTGSSYVALVGGSFSNITSSVFRVIERNSGGGFVGQTDVSIATATNSLLNRFSATRTLSGTAAFVQYGFLLTIPSGVPIDITLRIGMPQLEQGAFATSVIPTTTASATRAADVATITGSNFSGFYNQNEGTLFADTVFGAALPSSTFGGIFDVRTDASNRITLYWNPGTSNNTGLFANVSGSTVCTTSHSAGINTTVRLAGSYKLNDFASSLNGGAVQTDTSGTIPTATQALIGSIGTVIGQQYIRKIAYYPRRLSNDQLVSLTS
jgi:hypothetical protein